MGKTGIHLSAFLVNESRARNVALSRDRYSHLWVSPATRRLWEDFSRRVYPYDDIELGIRNRFFLEQLEAFGRLRPLSPLINIGAGFTSYPFLCKKPIPALEVDQKQVVALKKRKIRAWQRGGLLPPRKVEWFGADLQNGKDLHSLRGRLIEKIAGRFSLIFIEGVSYYLRRHALLGLFQMAAAIQRPGSFLVFDFWDPNIRRNPVFKRFRRYCAEEFGFHQRYNLLDPVWIRSLPGYAVKSITDNRRLEKRYCRKLRLTRWEEILPENYAVLRKR